MITITKVGQSFEVKVKINESLTTTTRIFVNTMEKLLSSDEYLQAISGN